MKKSGGHHMDMLAALLLFCVFAACVLMILLTGARVYRQLTARGQAACDRRTCVQYIATRVRQSDRRGAVTVEDFDGTPALVLAGEYGYTTRIYWYDGHLMELYSAADAGLSPEDGVELMPADGLTLSLEDGLLEIKLGGGDSFCLSLRSTEGASG